MAHSLELILDDPSDQQVRDEWAVLAEAGLPHQGRVASTTNRPHVTLIAASTIDPGADAALTPAAMRLPVDMMLGAPLVFGNGRRSTLARLVVPTTELLSIHTQVDRLAAEFLGRDSSPAFAHTQPGRWTPHVTLARRLDPDQLAHALGILDLRAEIAGSFVALRRWDPDAGVDHILPGRAC
ncbi:2'-5' RNA ligase family protein [Gordonia sp. 'Campus']|uniref:2'-5' RNA ligase family protein n=1 Tax=Gordonia sp. 'Campus' TaxID=2915824 RepID=UPI001EE3E687|nr:2'-5' RNA ligase family protein [Gordonia sp. 'Campus']